MRKEIPIEVVELEADTYHPLIKAEFPGLDNAFWVIDTGASKSVFDVTLNAFYETSNDDSVMATGLGKEVVATNSGAIAELHLGNFNFGILKVALVDFQHINDEYAKFSNRTIVGLIGCDFLYAGKATLNFKKRILQIAK